MVEQQNDDGPPRPLIALLLRVSAILRETTLATAFALIAGVVSLVASADSATEFRRLLEQPVGFAVIAVSALPPLVALLILRRRRSDGTLFILQFRLKRYYRRRLTAGGHAAPTKRERNVKR